MGKKPQIDFEYANGPVLWGLSATQCRRCERKITGGFSKMGDDGKVRTKKADSVVTQYGKDGSYQVFCFDCYCRAVAKAMAPTEEELEDEFN